MPITNPSILNLVARMGGDATDWNVSGLTVYLLGPNCKAQIGIVNIGTVAAGVGAEHGTFSFPLSFSAVPWMILTVYTTGFNPLPVVVHPSSITASTFKVQVKNVGSVSYDIQVFWAAIGAA